MDLILFQIGKVKTVSDSELAGSSVNCFKTDILMYIFYFSHSRVWSAVRVDKHDEKAARNVLRRMHHVNDITPRDFVEVCVDMKQQGVGGYDSWGARPEPFHQIPANRDYSWGFTLVPVRSASQANEVAKYDYQ